MSPMAAPSLVPDVWALVAALLAELEDENATPHDDDESAAEWDEYPVNFI
jgi:hypothetical protein